MGPSQRHGSLEAPARVRHPAAILLALFLHPTAPHAFADVDILDLQAIDPDLGSFSAGFVAGGRGFLVPFMDAEFEPSGKVVRFDTENFGSVSVWDLEDLDEKAKGFTTGFLEGTMAVLLPAGSGLLTAFDYRSWGVSACFSQFSSHFDTSSRFDVVHWGFGYQSYAFLASALHKSVARQYLGDCLASPPDTWVSSTELGGYNGAVSDGTYGYLLQHLSTHVLRFPLADFPGGGTIEELQLTPSLSSSVYFGTFVTDTHYFLVPHNGGTAGRIALATAVESKLDIAGLDPLAGAMAGGFAVGPYAYFCPALSGRLVRVHGEDFAQVESLDLTSLDAELAGFQSGFSDGTHVYLPTLQGSNGAPPPGKVVRLSKPATSTISSTTTSSSTSVSSSFTSSTSLSTSRTSSSSSSSSLSSSSTSSSVSRSTSSSSSTSSSRSSSSSMSSTSSSTSSSSTMGTTSSATSTITVSSSTTFSTSCTSSVSSMSSTGSSSSSASSVSSTQTASTVTTSSSATGSIAISSSATTITTSTELINSSATSSIAISSSATTATTSTTLPTELVNAAVEKAAQVESAMKEGAGLFLRSGLSIMNTSHGLLTITTAQHGFSSVIAPNSLLSLPQNALLAVLHVDASGALENVGLKRLATAVLAISVLDAELQKVTELREPLIFRLPDGNGSAGDCAFLEVLSNSSVRWSRKGVRRALAAEVAAAGAPNEGVWCRTEHLSIFVALTHVILGCSNLELLTPKAISTLWEHHGWWCAKPAMLFFAVTICLLLLLLLGTVREVWLLRLGRTHEEGKRVQGLCRACVQCGPHMLKHRYAALLVLVQDLLHCMAKGRERLRLPTLAAAVQRCLCLKAGISGNCVANHCWSGGAWLESSASLPHVVLCHKLNFHGGGAEKVIEEVLQGRSCLDVLYRYAVAFLACHPLLDSLRLGASSMSVRKRAILQVSAFFGIMATNAMIFKLSGKRRSWEAPEDCPVDPCSHLFIVVASVASISLNALPNAFLMEMARQVHGRPCWIGVFWTLAVGYLLTTALFVVVALANLNPWDQDSWHSIMEWSLCLKLLGVPAGQALRHSLMLEMYLRGNSQAKYIEQSMGLAGPHEEELGSEESEAVREMAKRGISAEELVCFVALLGDTVMLDFDPELSTSGQVFRAGVSAFCRDPESFQEAQLQVEVMEIKGLHLPLRAQQASRHLSCGVVHLSEQLQREQRSSAALASADGSCAWCFQASFGAIAFQDALEFVVSEMGNVLGTARLAMVDVLKGGGYVGELPVQRSAGSSAAPHATPELTGSRGVRRQGLALSPQARLSVKVMLPASYLPALALHERLRLRQWRPVHSSEALEDLEEARAEFLRTNTEADEVWGAKGQFAPSRPAYSAAIGEGHGPGEKLVVHSHEGNFIDLVTCLLVYALKDKEAWGRVRSALLARDFHEILDELREEDSQGLRFWIDMFGLDLSAHDLWHKDLLRALPTLVRTLKRDCCQQIIAEIQAKVPRRCGLLEQVVVLDKDLHLLREGGCLAEVQVACSHSLGQRLLLHPEHLKGPSLGRVLRGLDTADLSSKSMPWTQPYNEERQSLTALLASLVLEAVRTQRPGDDHVVEELELDDLLLVVASFQASRTERGGAVDSGDFGDTGDAAAADA